MRINYIELNGYKRLMLNNIKRIRITPHTRVQSILGTNGSGKSSLLGELTPCPAVAANYSKEGSKVISITHRGQDYLLTSDFRDGQKHSFIIDGKEDLNKGGTISVQKELVKKYFGITQEIHDLLTGVEKFSAMSPSRKREWFTQLCETNYDYALSVYNKVKERTRDTSGALKLAKKRLVVETSKLPSEDDVANIQSQINDILREITLLYENRSDEARSQSQIEAEQSRLLSEMRILSERLFSTKGHFGTRTIFTQEEYRSEIDIVKHQITEVTTKIDMLSSEYSQLKSSLDDFSKTGEASVTELRARQDALIKQKEAALSKRKLSLDVQDPVGALSALESIYELLTSIFTNIPVNENGRYSQANLEAAEEQHRALKDKLNAAEKKLDNIRHQKEHFEQLRSSGETECPKCNHRWVVGYNPQSYEKLVRLIEEGVTYIEETKRRLEELQTTIQENSNYGNLYREFARCVRTIPVLKCFWDYLLAGEHVYTSPTNALRLTELFKSDLNFEVYANGLSDDIEKTQHLIEIAMKASSVDMGNLKTRIDTIETELGILNKQLYFLKNTLSDRTLDYQRVSEIQTLEQKIRDYQTRFTKGVNDNIRALRNELINQCLNQLQIEVAQKQNILNDMKMQKGIVDDIQNNIETLTIDETALKLIVDSLSPTDGLIAEGLLGFIRTYIRKMNSLIKRTWTYRMEVQDCSCSNDSGAELDYKFPVLIQTADNKSPDVGKCSAGQREIIDLAFKITAMGYLGLSDYPLMLDELGATMDITHKSQVVFLIKYLIEQCSFSQIFIVSHDYDQYGSLSNLETCVICPNNVITPSVYNQHVEIT